MSGTTGPISQRATDILLEAHPNPVRYDRVIADCMYLVEPGRAHRASVAVRNSQRRLRGVATHEDSPTDRSIRNGRKRVTRNLILEQVRRGRFRLTRDDSGFAWLSLGDPGTTGGRNAKPKEWPTT